MSQTELRLISCTVSIFVAGFIANVLISNGLIYGGESTYLLVCMGSPFVTGLVSFILPWKLFSKNDPPDFDLILINVGTSVLIGVGFLAVPYAWFWQ